MNTVRIWDLPTRLFHWALVICVVGLVVSANVGGNAMVWHFRFGYSVLTLLLFRVVWGMVGGRWSRFGNFIYGPSRLMAYLRGQGRPEDAAGHSPTGALSVFAMLLVLFAQVSSGLFSDDDIAFAGPLAGWVWGATVSLATSYHKAVGKLLILGLVVLHILAILYYKLAKKTSLVGPMVTGDKQWPTPLPGSNDTAATRWGALVVLILCALAVNRLVALGAQSGF